MSPPTKELTKVEIQGLQGIRGIVACFRGHAEDPIIAVKSLSDLDKKGLRDFEISIGYTFRVVEVHNDDPNDVFEGCWRIF